MQNENLLKMSKMAVPPLMDTHTANILICYLFDQIKKPMQPTQLYDIAVGTNIINYFFYQEAISYLQKNDSLRLERDKNGKDIFVLTERGAECANQLKDYVGKAYRDKIVSVATQYFAKVKRDEEVKLSYIPLKKGYYVHLRCLDVQNDLLDLKLYAPDLKQAHYLGRQMMRNPAGFYGKILEAAFSNTEELSESK